MPMWTLKNDGMEYPVLGVDAEIPMGAYRVYEKLYIRSRRAEAALKKTD